MHVAHSHIKIVIIFREVFRHTLCESGDKHALLAFGPQTNFMQHIIDLSKHRSYFDYRFKQTCGTHHEFRHLAFGLLHFVISRSCRNINQSLRKLGKFRKLQRPVIHCGWQTKSMFHKGRFSRIIPAVHRSKLRQSHVTFVDKNQRIIWEIIEQSSGRSSGSSAVHDTAVIFNSGTGTGLFNHFQIILGALQKALSLQNFVVCMEIFETFAEFFPD